MFALFNITYKLAESLITIEYGTQLTRLIKLLEIRNLYLC